MFSPFLTELSISHSDVDLKKVESELLKSIKNNFDFKETEIKPEFIELRDSEPIFSCKFSVKNIEISSAIHKGSDELKKIMKLVFSDLNIKRITISNLELVSLIKFKEVKKLMNFHLINQNIEDYRISLVIPDEKGNTLKLSFLGGETAGYDYISAILNSNKDLISYDDFVDFYDSNIQNTYDTLQRILSSQEENVEDVSFREVIENE
ncbi:hypothetical protein [Paenibacillus polymyxa]|uniref:hypothetical protein n=1 Tax=Paenibacillus polymyxa TaxID=1406 RepID=UPI003D2C1CA3